MGLLITEHISRLVSKLTGFLPLVTKANIILPTVSANETRYLVIVPVYLEVDN